MAERRGGVGETACIREGWRKRDIETQIKSKTKRQGPGKKELGLFYELLEKSNSCFTLDSISNLPFYKSETHHIHSKQMFL